MKQKSFILLIFIILSQYRIADAQIYLDSTKTIEARVEDLLGRMTLDEKIGQMVQEDYYGLDSLSHIQRYCLGSVLSAADNGPAGKTPGAWADLNDTLQSFALKTRLGIPILFGIDAVHGIGSVYVSTLFPHNIGMGCTRNPQLVTQETQITAQEMAATGINWTFSPVVAVARNENWGRTYESFGEEPNLVKEMAGAAVLGFQGDTTSEKINILACAKHFIGDGGTTNGENGGNTQVDTATLKAIHLPGYISAIQQKVGSMMISQSNWNNVPCHGNHYLLTTLLKEELGFKGFLISDYESFMLAPGKTYGAKITTAVNAGMDMGMMCPYNGTNYQTFIDTLRTSVEQGIVSQDRIDDAVRRILTQKFRLGLFEHPYAKRSLISQVGSPEHRQVARECVRQSIVVLKKKDGILPISKNIKHIHMAGRHANNMGYQCGGWTITWQGGSGSTTIGTTVMQAVQNAVPNAEVTYSEDGFGADSAQLGIAVVGEKPYAETSDKGNLHLTLADIQTIRNLKSYNIPVIVILISGRPIYVSPVFPQCDAFIAAWLPGTEGEGIADVLFGDYQPTGVLSQTWPRSESQIPINVGDSLYNPLFAFGFGITSLNDSPTGSAPEVYSAGTTVGGQTMEISFNKKMISPPVSSSGFSVLADGTTPMNITSVNLKPNDSTTMVLTFADSVKKGKTYTISYAAGTAQSYDHGQLAAFNNLPVYNVMNDYTYVSTVPGNIKAETYNFEQGISSQPSTDVGGGRVVTLIDSGDWVQYNVIVAQSGDYTLEYRVSSAKLAGKINFIANGISLSTIDIPITGSITTWQTVSTTVHLSAGPQIFKLNFVKGGFFLNWMQLSLSTAVKDQGTTPQKYQLLPVYPNPFNPTAMISYTLPKKSHATLTVYDVIGREIECLVNKNQEAGVYHFQFSGNHLSSGIYFVKLQAHGVDGQKGDFVDVKKCILLK